MQVLVTGSNGQLGQSLQKISSNYPNLEFFWADRNTLDFTNPESIQTFLEHRSFDLCINCAAYTQVDKAETDKKLATQINATSVGVLAASLAKTATPLIHISTDYVFDGTNYQPITELDSTNPINFYGRSKLEGENLAIENNAKTLVIRTSWVYSEFGNNFVKTILKLLKTKTELKIINDQVGSPTYSVDLANVILKITQILDSKKETFQDFGIYHFTNEGVASWFDFAKNIQSLSGYANCQILPIPTTDYPLPASRPSYSVLDKTKIKTTFGLEIPYWQDSLKKLFEENNLLD